MMQYKIGESYYGFILLEENLLPDIHSMGRLFVHEKSGARLFHVQNEDDNKVFYITFRTPPKDSTGLPHIMEHSVLCGSRKFPAKDPFIELAKGSLNTYLNAMTFSDKTMYPIASRNHKDFLNLMDVYMDAVLYPLIYQRPETLMQEGWHYELENEEAPIVYKGVVYNEMKGAFSSPEGVLGRKIQESLFPDTTYRFESGGDPVFIPDLTQEQFLAFHQSYYHPSNSYIYLYGDGDLQEYLKFLDEQYLCRFDAIQVDSEIPIQKAFERPIENIIEYSVLADEKEEDKTFLSLNFAVCQATDPELVMAFDILKYILLQTPASPLKKALLEAQIGKDVFGSFDSHVLQPTWSVIVKNSNEQEKERFEKLVLDTLQQLVHQGIDKKLIEAAINIREFSLREADYGYRPKGLVYGIQAMSSWLYEENPILHLQYSKHLTAIKSALVENYFEDLIERYLLQNPHRSMVIVRPKRGMSAELEAETREHLKRYKQGLSREEIKGLIEETARLKALQMTEESGEALAKIPLLSLEDIKEKAERYPIEEKEIHGIKTLIHPIVTNEIIYLQMIFDTTAVPQELIPYVGLLSHMLGKVSTDRYSYEALSNEINIYTGGIGFKIEAFSDQRSDLMYLPKFIIKSKVLTSQLPKLMEILEEIICHTRYEEEKRIQEMIREIKSRLEMGIFDQGHTVAAGRVLSYFSPLGKYKETVSGMEFYQFIAALEKNLHAYMEEIRENLQRVSRLILNKRNLLISVTLEEKDYPAAEESLQRLLQAISGDTLQHQTYTLVLSDKKEGILTSAKVQYVAKGANFVRLGYSYTGQLHVLRTILSLEYLWNQVRIQGGAYGCITSFARSGNMYFSSYRDPNLEETLDVYNRAYEFVQNFSADSREMTKYILGTINRLDPPLGPGAKGETAAAYYIGGISQEEIQKEREEVLCTTAADIRTLAPLLKAVMEENYVCVLGNEEMIRQSTKVFDKEFKLFE